MKKDKNICLILCPPIWPNLPPLGLAYLTSSLEKYGYSVTILDLNISLYNQVSPELKTKWTISDQSLEKYLLSFFKNNLLNDVLYQLSSWKVAAIGFSLFKKNLTFSLELAKIIKSQFPQLDIIFGGPECTQLKYQKGKRWSDEIDYLNAIIIGDGEISLLKYLENKKRKNNQAHSFFYEEEIVSLDDLPFPSFDGFPLMDYPRKKALPILTSKGCTNRCSFCSERLLYHGYRFRNPAKVVEEIEYQMEKYQTKWFTFYDSLINSRLKELNCLCDLLMKKKLRIKWDAQAIIRADMPEELLDKMKEAGCFNLFIGLESGSDNILRRMNKSFTTREASVFFRKCFHKGVHFEISLIVGFPGENEREFEETIHFIKSNKDFIPKIAQVNPYIPYQGTSIYNEIETGKKQEISYSIKRQRVKKLRDLFNQEVIIYTQSYINNLTEPNPDKPEPKI